jgi:hypothetical protein
MRRKRKRAPGKDIESWDIGEITTVIKALAKQFHASKKIYFRHQGVVTCSRTVPDHAIQLRATTEILKMYGVFPRRGERESGERYDRSERPVINLVITGKKDCPRG